MVSVWQQPEIIAWTQILLNSYQQLLGKELIARNVDITEQAKHLFYAPFAVVSHGTEADPIFNYANQTAQNLWEMNWEQFTKTHSRLSAEPVERVERARMLQQVNIQGYIDDYQGVRISSTGKRFLIEKGMVWNLANSEGEYFGQAATFSQWSFLN